MRHWTIIIALLVLPAISAQAQTTVEPRTAALARELIEVSGGRKAIEANIDISVATTKRMLNQSFTKKISDAFDDSVFVEMENDMKAQIPNLIEINVSIYADNYTEKELEDYLAWLKSDSGQAVIRKASVVAQQASLASQPLFADMMPKMFAKMGERICAKNHCTPEQRQQMDEAMAAMFKK